MMTTVRKMVITIIVAVVTVACLIAVIVSTRSYALTSSDTYSVKDVLRIQKERGEMEKALKGKNIYPMYYAIKANNHSISNDKIEEDILEGEAFFWYAENEGLAVTDAELQRYIDSLVNDAKESLEYSQYEKAAAELGVTYEEIVRNDSETYRLFLTREKIWEKMCKQISTDNNDTLKTTEEIEHQREQNLEKWNSFKKNIVKHYKASVEYKKLMNEMVMCRELLKHNVSEISKIQLAEEDLQ